MRESKAKPTGGITEVRGKLIPVLKAGEITGIGKDWFYRHMNAATLPFPWYQLSVGKRFMDSADIEDYINRCKVPAGKLPGEY